MRRYLILGSLLVFAVLSGFMAGDYFVRNIQRDNNIPQIEEMAQQGMLSKQEPEQQEPGQAERGIKVVVGGDVLLDRSVGWLIDRHGSDSIWGDLKSILNSADISMINLENPLSNYGSGEKDKQFVFRGKPEYVAALKSTGIDIVSLANNHIMDYGEIALMDTIKNLDAAGILYAGAGENEDNASRPVYIKKGSVTLAVLSSSHVIPFAHWRAGNGKPGVASAYDPSRLQSEVESASKKADAVLVYLHWGEELKEQPLQYQKKLGRLLIDAGADLVVGSHPHVVQGLEFYKGKLIAYSLGNLIFTNNSRETMLLSFELSKQEMPQVYVIPCMISSSKTILINNDTKRQDFFNKLNTLSSEVFVNRDGKVMPND